MIDVLLQDTLKRIPAENIARTMYLSARQLARMHKCLAERGLASYLKPLGVPTSSQLHSLSVPALIGNSLRSECWSLYEYPLGEYLERAILRTIATLMYSGNCRISVLHGLSEQPHDFQQKLQEVMRATKFRHFLKLFITYFLFEIGISNLRSRTSTGIDLGYSYEFADGRLVDINSQLSLRNAVLQQCDQLSSKLLPYLLQSLKQRSVSSALSHLSNGVTRVLFDGTGRARKLSAKPSRPYLNIIVGTKPKSQLQTQYCLAEDAIRIILDGDKRNVTLDFTCFESLSGHPLHTLTKDLLEIAFVIYISDICVKRNPDLSRKLHILMPVRHLEVWSKSLTQLERTISFLARDDVTIHLVKKKGRCDPMDLFCSAPRQNECTCLLSGGLDSAAGAVWSLENGLKPIFVSYSSGGILTKIQTDLFTRLEKETKLTLRRLTVPWQLRRAGAYRLVKQKDSLLYQHLRSFFYLSLATAAAVESKCADVYICENGPIALNPLISESHVNTRTVHPLFLEHYQTLIRSIFPVPITIHNPFLYETKGQIARYLVNRKLTSLIPLTNSCFYYYGVKAYAQEHFDIKGYAGKHDGDCLPCIIRRVSLHCAHVPDKYDDYLTDVFNLFDSPVFRTLPDRSLQTLVRMADLLRFAQYLSTMNAHELSIHFPDLYPYAQDIDYDKLTLMYHRYSEEILDCFRSRSSQVLCGVFRICPAP